MLEGTDIPQAWIHPGMGERWGRPIKEQGAIMIPNESFQRITEKIVRGIFYIQDRKFIEPPFTVCLLKPNDVTIDWIRHTLDSFGHTYALEPGIVVRRAVTPEDGVGCLFELEIWKQFKVYAAVTNLPFNGARKR